MHNRQSIRRHRVHIALAIVGMITVAGCSSSGKTASGNAPSGNPSSTGASSTSAAPTTTPAPAGLPAFYGVPQPLPVRRAGTLLKAAKVDAPTIHGTAYRVMYESRTLQNQVVAVTGVVIVPTKPAPAGGYPVVTWGHGTNGMADICAPSLDVASAAPLANALLDRGWEVTASDYQGEGTPGIMPYISGVIAARNTIDIVRAARQLTGAHASADYVVWGHSEGGQTAMFALDIAHAYAPELHLDGVVAGAPPSQFGLIYSFLKTSPFRYYLLMAAGGLHAAYGTAAPLDQVLTPAGMALLPELDKVCTDVLSKNLGTVSVAGLTKGDPFTIPAWRKVLMANDPENFTAPSTAPLLMIQGGSDEQIPVVSTQILAKHECDLGQDLERWIYPGQSHAGVIAVSAGDMIHWIADRFAGVANPDQYVPTGQAGIQRTQCPA
jgi:alpha-beta hydrolase superfamily lysophospholipase